MARRLRHLGSRALALGRRIVRMTQPPPDPVRQRYVERRGFIITDLVAAALPASEKFTILDGGALDAYADPRWQALDATRTRIYGFEPNALEVKRLNATAQEKGLDHRYFAGALWSRATTVTFHANKASGGGSLYEQNTDLTDRWKFENFEASFNARDMFRPTVTSQWATTSIDQWASESSGGPPDIDFMKLNVQGAELEILQGADSVIDRTIGVMAEMSFVESYKGRPFFADVDRHLRDKNFTFFDFIGHHCIGRAESPITVRHLPSLHGLWGQLIEGHGIYFRDPIDMAARGLSIDHRSAAKLLKLAAFAEVMGQIEYSFELLSWLETLLDRRGDAAGARRVNALAAQAAKLYVSYMA
ncbi:MAG TPA: FkbM family methyltransferase [Candidatus Sulfotelmatobacter sp.]|nr:FkbM family methyltransferase [Candidatus Sulfotelmatobacter sp.]